MVAHFFDTETGAPFWAQVAVVLIIGGAAGFLLASGIWTCRWLRIAGSAVIMAVFIYYLLATGTGA